jgi:hypothetical protein
MIFNMIYTFFKRTSHVIDVKNGRKSFKKALNWLKKCYIVSMNTASKYTDKLLSMERLQAFALFQKEGMKAVEQTYPEHVAFVVDHKANTYREVKQELFPAYQEC